MVAMALDAFVISVHLNPLPSQIGVLPLEHFDQRYLDIALPCLVGYTLFLMHFIYTQSEQEDMVVVFISR